MSLRIDATNPAPLFEQLRAQLVEQVRGGELAPGAKLPTVRELAAELGIAVNTAAKVYRLLEDDGVIETFGRRGTFVAAQGDAAERALQDAAASYAALAARLGVSAETSLGYVAAALG